MRTKIALVPVVALVIVAVSGCAQTETVPVPDVTGMSVAESSQAVVGAGLVLGTVAEEPSDEVEAGLVISQTPRPGESAAEGSAITLSVSTGPAPVVVPDVVGMSPEDATAALEATGLVADDYIADGPTDDDAGNADVGRVYRQTPVAGSEVPKGTPVEIRYWFSSG